MKSFIFFLFVFMYFPSVQALETVPSVDVSQFIGRWYQIARNPLPFEPEGCACAQQTLSLDDSSSDVNVYNSCHVGGPEGPVQEIRGRASVDNPGENTKLTVDFGFPRKGSYWIIGLAADYGWTVVTDKDANSLYILSKTPELSQDQYLQALLIAQEQVSLERLKLTSHLGCTYP